MRSTESRPGAGQAWLLGGLGLVVAPHLARLPLWLSALCLLALGWRLLYELGRARLPGRLVRVGLTAALVGGVALAYHSVIGREAGVALLIGLVCLKTLEMRSRRDLTLVVFLALFTVITGFLFSQSLLMGVYMFGVVWVILAALLAADQPQTAEHAGRHWYGRRAGLLLAQAVPLAAVMFLLFPRPDGPLWGMPETAGARTGLSDSMSPGAISELAASEAIAFRVDFDGPLPAAERMYWRGPVLDAFDGYTWRPLHAPTPAREPLAYRASDAALGYTVTVEPHERRWLFALDLPAALPVGAYVTEDMQLISRTPVRERRAYRMQSHLDYTLTAESEAELGNHLRLPADSAPRTRALAQRLAAEAASPDALVESALALFADGPFRYTRNPPRLTHEPVDRFLFESQQGFCEHYAGAFTVLMRAAGVPARVVTGYLGGEINPLGGYLIVRQSDAHAWSEVWLPERGWTRVDPTALIPAARIESERDLIRRLPASERHLARPLVQRALRQLRHGWDRVNHGWNQWVIGYDAERQQGFLARLRLTSLGNFGQVALLTSTVAGLTLGLALLRRRPPGRRDPVQAGYRRFCRRLARLGVVRRPGEGPLDFARRAARARPDLAEPIMEITRRYVRLRYAQHAEPDDLRALGRAVRALRPRLIFRYRNSQRSAPADPPR